MYRKDIKIIHIIFGLFILGTAAVITPLKCERYERMLWENSGIPDVVSTRNISGRCYITVVSNSREITDSDKLITEVIRLYRKNAFRSVKFSTDIGGRPERIEVAVYFQKSDVGEKEPEFSFSFIP